MTFKQRLPYYLFGLLLGVIVVVFVFDKKETSFDYGPNARVLKNIKSKKRLYSNKVLYAIELNKIDTASISLILNSGNADLWNKIKFDTCTQYNINGVKQLKHITLTVNNCNTTAIIEKVSFKQN